MSQARRAPSRLRKLFSRQRRAAGHRPRSRMQAERLELRQLMAGDFNPYHNYWYAQDVNNDYVATPLDALLVINALNASGPRELTAPATGGAQGEPGQAMFMDVSGDGFLTPIDALDIINHLNAQEAAPIAVQFRLRLFGENGREITSAGQRSGSGTLADPYVYTVSKDERFGVSLQVLDARPQGPAGSQFDNASLGVFSAFTDLTYDPSRVALGFSEVQSFTLSDIDVNGDGQTQINITVPGLGTTGPITLTEPGILGADPSVDRTSNANSIRIALNSLTGTALNDVFRVTVDGNRYTIKFLGDFVNRDIGPVTVAPVAGTGDITIGAIRQDYQPVGTSEVQQFTLTNIQRVDENNPAQITLTIPGVGTTAPISLTQPGLGGADPILARNANRSNIQSALNTLTGNDDFRVSFSGDTYSVNFLGTFANTNPGAITATTVAGSVSIASGSTTTQPITVETANKAVMDRALNFSSLYGPVSDPEGGARTFELFTPIDATHAAIQRAGAIATGDTSTSDGDGTDYQSPGAQPPVFREFFRPYFVAANATPAGQPTEIAINPPGIPDDSELDPASVLLLIGDTEGFDPKVRRESIDYGAPIRIIVRADVTATPDAVTVNEGSTNNPVDVLANDTNNVTVGGPKVITGLGADGKQTSFTIPNQGTVTFDGTNISFTALGDFFGTFTFQYGLTDTGTDPKDIGTVTITVAEQNDNPVAGNDTVTIGEDAGPVVLTTGLQSILLNDNAASDPTSGAAGTFDVLAITQVNGAASATTSKGTVSVTGGVVTYTPSANASGADSFTYTLSDGRGGTATATVNINITPVNDPPSFTLTANHLSTEDGGAQSQTGFASAINPGPVNANPQETDGPVNFVVTPVSGDATLTFAVQPTIIDGELTYTAAPNAFGTATFRATASDIGEASSFQDFTITVTPDNDAPEFIVPATFQSNEDAPVSQANFVTGITAGPNEGTAGVTFTVNVLAGNTVNFAQAPAIDANGTLTFTPAANSFGTATLEIIASDGSATTTKTVALTVANTNDNPVANPDTAEALDGEITIVDVIGNDDDAPDAGETLTITSISPSGDVVVNGLTVNLSIGTDTNGNSVILVDSPEGLFSGTLNVDYTISDGNGGTATSTVALTFAPSELPRAISDTFPNTASPTTISEDTGDFALLNVLANDRRFDTANGALSISQIRFPAGTFLSDTGVANAITDASGNTIYISDDRLTVGFRPGPNVQAPVSFEYEVTETPDTQDGPSIGAATVNIVANNDIPSFTIGDSTVDVSEDDPLATTTFVDFATAISQGPNESGQALTFEVVSNDNTGLFASSPALSSTGTLSFTLAENANGVANLMVRLVDDGGTPGDTSDDAFSAAVPVTITVAAVNDAPTFTAGADQTVGEDGGAQTVTGWAQDIVAGPTDEDGQALTFAVTGNTNTALFSVQPSVDPVTGTLTFTPAANAFGTATITLTLSDNGGGTTSSSSQDFEITITPVNDPPTFTVGGAQTVNEDAGAQTVADFITASSTGAPNETQGLSYEITGNTDTTLFAAGPAINSDGDLTYTPAANANGAATISVRIRDDNGTPGDLTDDAFSASQDFTITVQAVNDAPTFTPGANVTRAEDSGAHSQPWATNPLAGPANESGQDIQFNVSNDNNALFSVQPTINDAGVLTFTPAANANGTATVTVTLSDDGGTDLGGVDTSAQQTFTISITAVNDTPSFDLVADPDQQVDEDAALQTVNNFAVNISAGPANESGQQVSFVVTSDNSSLFQVQPTISSTGVLTFQPAANANGSATVTVSIRDDNGTPGNTADDLTSASQTFTIEVDAVNDPPTADPDEFEVFKTVEVSDPFNLVNDDSSAPDVGEDLRIVATSFTAVADAGSPSADNITFDVTADGKSVILNNPDGFYGTITLNYTIRDRAVGDPEGLEDSSTATFSVLNFKPGFVSGVIWADADNDGVVDPGNPPMGAERLIAGVEVYLYGETMFGDTYNLVATTNAQGQYSFSDGALPSGGIVPGNYTVSLDNPATPQVEGVELFSDGQDRVGTVTDATVTRTANNTFQVVFGAEGATVSSLNFGVLGLHSRFVNIRDHLASSSPNGIVFGSNLAAAANSQQYWSTLYDGWTGWHDLKLTVSSDLSSATLEGRNASNELFRRTLSFTGDATRIRIMGRDGNNIVVRIVGSGSGADAIFNASHKVAGSSSGAQGEAMYSEGDAAAYAAAADALYGEEAWA